MSDLYNFIDSLCKDRGETVTSLCRATGITRTSLSELKSGRAKSLSYKTMKLIADHFDITVESLANGGQEPKNPNELDEFAFALYNETKGLTHEQKNLLIRLAREMQNRKD